MITSIFWSAATLSAALPSWCRPSTAFSTVRPTITSPVPTSCSAAMLTDRRAEQHELHEVAVLAQERPPAGLLLGLRELVRPELRSPPLDLDLVEPVSRIDAEPFACRLRRQAVPDGAVGLRPDRHSLLRSLCRHGPSLTRPFAPLQTEGSGV